MSARPATAQGEHRDLADKNWLAARFADAKKGSGDRLAERLSADTGVDFSALQKAAVGKNLGAALSAVGFAKLGITVAIVVGPLMVFAYILLLIPNADHLHSMWATGFVDVVGLILVRVGRSLLGRVDHCLFVRAADGRCGLWALFLDVQYAVDGERGADARKLPQSNVRETPRTLGVVTIPVLLDFTGSKIPIFGAFLARRVKSVVTGVLVDRILDPEDHVSEIENEEPGEAVDEATAQRLIAGIAAKTRQYSTKAEAANQYLLAKITRPFLGAVAFSALMTFGPLIGLAILELT